MIPISRLSTSIRCPNKLCTSISTSHCSQKSQKHCGLADLSVKNVEDYHTEFEAHAESLTETVLELEHKMSISEAAKSQFDKAYQLVCKNCGGNASFCGVGKCESNYYVNIQAKNCRHNKRHNFAQNYMNPGETLAHKHQSAVKLLNDFNQRANLSLQTAEELAIRN